MSANDLDIMELKIRKYFDHFLEKTLPILFNAHDKDVAAHEQQIQDAVESGSLRLKIWVFSSIFTVGVGSGVGVAKILAVF